MASLPGVLCRAENNWSLGLVKISISINECMNICSELGWNSGRCPLPTVWGEYALPLPCNPGVTVALELGKWHLIGGLGSHPRPWNPALVCNVMGRSCFNSVKGQALTHTLRIVKSARVRLKKLSKSTWALFTMCLRWYQATRLQCKHRHLNDHKCGLIKQYGPLLTRYVFWRVREHRVLIRFESKDITWFEIPSRYQLSTFDYRWANPVLRTTGSKREGPMQADMGTFNSLDHQFYCHHLVLALHLSGSYRQQSKNWVMDRRRFRSKLVALYILPVVCYAALVHVTRFTWCYEMDTGVESWRGRDFGFKFLSAKPRNKLVFCMQIDL